MNNFIVVIPARGGSKRVPKKNIFPILGKPLIDYSLEKIQYLGWDAITYVSSDSDEICNYAKAKKIKFHKRPEKFALDNSSTESVLIDVLNTFFKINNLPDYVITLPPTSPLLDVRSISNAKDKFIKNSKDYDSLISVTRTKMDLWHYENKLFKRIFPNAPRSQQERDPIFEENSAIYFTKTDILLKTNSILGSKVLPFQISSKEACDINTFEDINLVEFFLRNNSE